MVLLHDRDVAHHLRDYATVVVPALVMPVAYFAYVLGVRWLQGNPITVFLLRSSGMGLYVTVLALTGGVAGLAWRFDLRITPAATLAGAILWPWFYLSIPIGSPGNVTVLFGAVLLVAAAEATVRYHDQVQVEFTGEMGQLALAVGALHFVLGFGLQYLSRRLWWLDPTLGPSGIAFGAVLYVVLGLGLFATGAVPVLLWNRERLVAPGAMVTGWFLWGAYGTVARLDTLPLSEFTAIDWTGLVPYPDYVLKVIVLVILVAVLAGIELALRRAGQYYLDAGNQSSR